jgi:hypothetical protein
MTFNPELLRPTPNPKSPRHQPDVSLRDKLAMKAMQAVIIHSGRSQLSEGTARDCYKMADDMLKAGKVKVQ